LSDMNRLATLMQRLSQTYDADVAISPMIVVGGNDPQDLRTGWIGCNKALEQACSMAETHPLTYWVNADGLSQLRSHATDHGFMVGLETRTAILNMQSSRDDSLLTNMLDMMYDDAVQDYVVIVVIRPDQVDAVRASIQAGLSIPAPLVPVWWQDADIDPMRMSIVGHATLVGRSNGRYFISAHVAKPYPHEVEIDMDMGDMEDDQALERLQELGPDRSFAVIAGIEDGRMQAAFSDLVLL